MPFNSETAKLARAARMAKAKSGDSLLQDGEEARETERTQGAKWSPEERREHLPAELQDSAEQKKSVGDVAGADAALRAIEGLTRLIEGLSKRIETVETSAKVLDTDVPVSRLPLCPICGQYTMNAKKTRGVCDGTHVPIFVGPKSHNLYASFQAIVRNGQKYIGRCLLPTAIVDSVLADISRWEMIEQAKFIPHNRLFDTETMKLVNAKIPVVIPSQG